MRIWNRHRETIGERRAKRKCCQWINKDELPPIHSHEEDWGLPYICKCNKCKEKEDEKL